jgi:hypothetical protein
MRWPNGCVRWADKAHETRCPVSRAFAKKQITHIATHLRRSGGAPHVLYSVLVNSSLEFALATIEDGLQRPGSPTRGFVGPALAKLLQDDPPTGYVQAGRLLQSNDLYLRAQIGWALELRNLKTRWRHRNSTCCAHCFLAATRPLRGAPLAASVALWKSTPALPSIF